MLGLLAPIVNFFIDLLTSIFDFIIGLLPQTPFNWEPLDWGPFGQAIGYFIPIGTMITHLAIILVAIGIWYVCRWLMRLIRYIQ